jgi:hypothetical protein
MPAVAVPPDVDASTLTVPVAAPLRNTVIVIPGPTSLAM